MNFKQQIAKYVTGNLRSDQLPNIGIAGLVWGLDSPSLCILAVLNKNDSPFEIDHYFKLTIEELNIKLPDLREAALEYALSTVDKIIDGKKEIISGTREIRYKAIDSYDFFDESIKYCYDSIGFEKAYGLFDTFEDLSNAKHRWQKGKTNEILMTETKTELLKELKKWRERLINVDKFQKL